MKKTEGQDLSLLCKLFSSYIIHLAKITEKIILNDINFKYNFIIIPVENNELIKIENDYGSEVKLTNPIILNYTLEEEINIKYIMTNPSNIKSLKINSDAINALQCTDSKHLKTCLVPKEHFIGKKDGYYFTQYDNNYTLYDASPIKVILPPEDFSFNNFISSFNNNGTSGYIINLSFLFGIILIVAIAFFIRYHSKNTDKKDENLLMEIEGKEENLPMSSQISQ